LENELPLQRLSALVSGETNPSKTLARCRGTAPCTTCVEFIALGYDTTLCSLAGRPHTPQQRELKVYQHINASDLIKKRDLLDPLEDDDDIVWKENPFEVNSLDESEETPEQLLPMFTFEGSEQLQTRLKALVLEFIDVFATKVRKELAAVEPMKIVIDKEK